MTAECPATTPVAALTPAQLRAAHAEVEETIVRIQAQLDRASLPQDPVNQADSAWAVRARNALRLNKLKRTRLREAMAAHAKADRHQRQRHHIEPLVLKRFAELVRERVGQSIHDQLMCQARHEAAARTGLTHLFAEASHV